ncbi:membrane protein [Bacteroidia bacterium]|nr:membrane protein [Bacteroidia bacterium]
MKNKIFYAALLALPFALYSCNKDNNNGPVDEVQGGLVIKKDADAANIVKGILKTQSPGSGLSFLVESASDAAVSFEGDDDAPGPLISRFDITGANEDYVGGQYNKHYVAIAQVNELLAILDTIPAGAAADGFILTVAGKNIALGGAYFARAYSYFNLVQLYGGVPIYTAVGETNGSRASVDKVYKQIESDLLEAEKLLPTSTGVKTVPSQYAAQAILAKVYLTWAQYSDQGDLDATPADQAKLAKAVTYADKVIESGEFILLDDFTKNWGRHNKNGREHIYNQSYVLGDARSNDGGNHQSHCAFSYGFDANPNDQPTHIGPASYDLYTKWDNDNSQKDYDQRRDFSYTDHLLKPGTDSVYQFNPTTGWLPLFGKGIDRSFPNGAIDGPAERDLDRIEIRYAEVLLIKAEALIEQNKNLGEAQNLINQVRARAYNTAPTNDYLITASSQTDLRNALRQERANEFVYEQKRWFDLVRWHVLEKTILTVQNYPEYTASPAAGTFFAKVKKHLTERVTAVTGSGAKYYTFPIPDAAIESNPNLATSHH